MSQVITTITVLIRSDPPHAVFQSGMRVTVEHVDDQDTGRQTMRMLEPAAVNPADPSLLKDALSALLAPMRMAFPEYFRDEETKT